MLFLLYVKHKKEGVDIWMKTNIFEKYRDTWVGIAMLWIVFFHLDIDIGNKVLSLIKLFGYGGVDICLFCSGIGCYNSLKKMIVNIHL